MCTPPPLSSGPVDGAALFARLQLVAGPDADESLYYDESAGWDIDALLSDMSVYGPSASPPTAPPPSQPQQMSAQSPALYPPGDPPPHTRQRHPSPHPPLTSPTPPQTVIVAASPLSLPQHYSPAPQPAPPPIHHAAPWGSGAPEPPEPPEPSFQEMLASAVSLEPAATPSARGAPGFGAPPAAATPSARPGAYFATSMSPRQSNATPALRTSQASWQSVGPGPAASPGASLCEPSSVSPSGGGGVYGTPGSGYAGSNGSTYNDDRGGCLSSHGGHGGHGGRDGLCEGDGSEVAAAKGGGGWLVDLIEGNRKPAELFAGGMSWLRHATKGEGGGGGGGGVEDPAEAPAFVYNQEIKAWIPSGMSAQEWLAREAEERRREELRAAPPPPPTFGAAAALAAPAPPMGSAAMGPPHATGGPPAPHAPPGMSAPVPGNGSGYRRPTGKHSLADHYRAQAGM